MRRHLTGTFLRRELLINLSVLAAAALAIGLASVVLVYSFFEPNYAAVYVGFLVGADLTVLLVLTRLVWRGYFGRTALEGGKRIVFAMLTLLGFWALFAAGQVGGSISHP